jgi:hypothetical protein
LPDARFDVVQSARRDHPSLATTGVTGECPLKRSGLRAEFPSGSHLQESSAEKASRPFPLSMQSNSPTVEGSDRMPPFRKASILKIVLYRNVYIYFLLLSLNQPAWADPIWVSCKPIEAATFPERVHVKCAAAIDDRFSFFAAATTDARFAARALSVIEAAQLGDKYVLVRFDPNDETGTSFGCGAENCRRLSGVIVAEAPLPAPGSCVFDTNRPGCPGYCSTHDDRSCPGYCTRHPDDRECPGYCSRHPDDRSCPDFCRRHPRDPDCEADPCISNPHLPNCPR